jgi:tetrapyrrole methylase family protein/MazG family protein
MNQQSSPKLTPPGKELPGFQRLAKIMEQLRSPQGCPWDREQTPLTLRSALIEEVYEAVESINEGDPQHIQEELGDAYLMITMIAQIYQESGQFQIEHIFDTLCEKLIRRHPHVYGDSVVENPEDVAKQWKQIKEQVEGRKKALSVLDSVSHGLPPMDRAYKMQKKAAKAGFDWTDAEDVWKKAEEEIHEAREEWRKLQQLLAYVETSGNRSHTTDNAESPGNGTSPSTNPSANTSSPIDPTPEEIRSLLEGEIGDLLFSIINVSRFLSIDPGLALQRTNKKFDHRFRYVEEQMKKKGLDMNQANFQIMDDLWEQSKLFAD